jgi:HAD superfamily hydrolase (TIGR01549 family)
MTLKAVLFDFDDTLIDIQSSRELRARRAHQLLVDEGHQVPWRAFWHSLMALHTDGFRRGMPLVIRELGLEGTPLGDECIDLWFFKGCEDLLTLTLGCTDLLDELRQRYRLGIITNGPADVQQHKFAHTGLSDYFELFLPSGEIGVHKPEPEIFRVALKRLGLSSEEAVFVGDHLDLDVVGAQRAGIRAIWFSGAGKRSDDPSIVPDAVIRRLEDLPAVLATLG